MFWGQIGWLTTLRFSVGLGILIYLLVKKQPFLQRLALTLIASGAIGNAIDGYLRDGVVDMLVLHPLSYVYNLIFRGPFPIFNFADVGVVSGAFLFIASSFVKETPPEQAPISLPSAPETEFDRSPQDEV